MDTLSKVTRNDKQPILNCTWMEFTRLIDILSKKIAPNKYNSIYGIPRAGLIVAAMLAYRLNLPVVESEHITKETLIVDEITDSGKTLISMQEKYDCETAVLHKRIKTIAKPTYFVELLKTDDWIHYPYEEE